MLRAHKPDRWMNKPGLAMPFSLSLTVVAILLTLVNVLNYQRVFLTKIEHRTSRLPTSIHRLKWHRPFTKRKSAERTASVTDQAINFKTSSYTYHIEKKTRSIASDILSTILLPNPYQKHILQPYVQILK